MVVDEVESPVDGVAERGLGVGELDVLGVAHAVVVGAVAVGTVDRPLEAGVGQRVAAWRTA